MNNTFSPPKTIYPCKIKWKQTERSKIMCITLPYKFFEPSATSLSQMKKNTDLQKFVMGYTQFIVHSLYENAKKLGKQKDDFYINYENPIYSRNVSFTGDFEDDTTVQPKYSIAVEYLARDTMDLKKYSDLEEGETEEEANKDLNEVFSDSNFAGIRIWVLLFDTELDPHQSFKRSVESNQKFAKKNFLVNVENVPKAIANKIVYGRGKRGGQRRSRNEDDLDASTDSNDSEDLERLNINSNDDSTYRYLYTNGTLDTRTACERQQIDNPKLYHRDFNTWKKLALASDIFRRAKNDDVYRNSNLLDDLNYNICEDDPDFNLLHISHWSDFRTQLWMLFEHDSYGNELNKSYVNMKQIEEDNYYSPSIDGLCDVFSFPFPQLVFMYRPEHCSVNDLFELTFAWKNISRFDSFYNEIRTNYELKNELESQKKREKLKEASRKKRETGVEVNEYDQTPEQSIILNKIRTMKYKFPGGNRDKNVNMGFPKCAIKDLAKSPSLISKYLGSEIERNKVHIGTSLSRLRDENKNKYDKLKQISVMDQDAYKKALKIYKEEVISEFVKVFNTDDTENSDAVQIMLLWFEREEQIKIYDQYGGFYKTLCRNILTLDPKIGRYCSAIASSYIMLESLYPISNIHDSFLESANTVLYGYVDPNVAQEQLGTKAKPIDVNLGAPGTGKSYRFELLCDIMINDTLTRIDDMTERALMTGDNKKLMDTIFLVDEGHAIFQQDPAKMNSEQRNQYKTVKSIFTTQEHNLLACNYNNNTSKRKTDRIRSQMGITMLTNINLINTSAETSLIDRCSITVNRYVKRYDRNVVALIGSSPSDKTVKNRNLFKLKNQIQQFLFCEICKMQKTYVQPVGVNIQIGKILFDSMRQQLISTYPCLDNVRTTQQLYIKFYTRAILDAIDIYYFSEASPLMIHNDDGSIFFQEFSHKQVQEIMPALCLSEDSAIFLITGWIRKNIHREDTYDILSSFAQSPEYCNYKFPPIEKEVKISDKILEQIDKTWDTKFDFPAPPIDSSSNNGKEEEDEEQDDGDDYSTNNTSLDLYKSEDEGTEDNDEFKRKHLDSLRTKVLMCTKFLKGERDPLKVYATKEEVDSGELFHNIKYKKIYKKVFVTKREKINGKIKRTETDEFHFSTQTDTNYLEFTFRNENHCIEELTKVIHKKRPFSKYMVAYRLKEAMRFNIGVIKPNPIYDEDGNDVTDKHYKAIGNGIYQFSAVEQKTTKNGAYKLYISVHYLEKGSLSYIISRAIQSFTHKYTRERHVIINDFVHNSPYLFKVIKLKPRPNHILKVLNPNYVNPANINALEGSTGQNNQLYGDVCDSMKSSTFTLACDLDEKVFKDHFKACGMDEDFTLFIPRVVNSIIAHKHNSLAYLRERKKYYYPISFIGSVERDKQRYNKMLSDLEKAMTIEDNTLSITPSKKKSKKTTPKIIEIPNDNPKKSASKKVDSEVLSDIIKSVKKSKSNKRKRSKEKDSQLPASKHRKKKNTVTSSKKKKSKTKLMNKLGDNTDPELLSFLLSNDRQDT